MTRSLLKLPVRPTALFAGNNFIAIGALKTLHDAGLAVPENMSVVSFDDLPAAILVEPFLTVAAQPAYEMGQRATRRLLECLNGQNCDGVQDIVLPVSIIERRSTLALA
jgi:LacI family transcriptional regulator